MGAVRQFAPSPVWGNGIGPLLIASGRDSGQDRPKHRLAERAVDHFFRAVGEAANPAAVGLPVELKPVLPAQPQQVIDQSDDPARRTSEDASLRPREL